MLKKRFFGILTFILWVMLVFALAGCDFTGNEDPDDNNSGNSGNSSDSGGSSSNKTPGSTKENAILVTVGHSASYTINSDGTHWFKFIGTGETVIFETTGNVVDTVLHDDKYILTRRDDNSGEGYNFLYSFKTTLGETSFLFIKAGSGTSGTYTFIVE